MSAIMPPPEAAAIVADLAPPAVAPATVTAPPAEPVTTDAERPTFHLMPRQGWVNDPNGPIYYQGYYHMFYQHVPEGSDWSFGLVWGHAISSDLVHWQHLPNALEPSATTLDADGCFSGCAAVTADGTPVLLYTGVRMRTNTDCGPLPPPEHDLQLPFIESQLAAVGNPDDPLLRSWRKLPNNKPLVALPPAHLGKLLGWRDPFLLEERGPAGEYQMLVGSGIEGRGGTVLLYRSDSLLDGWQLHGVLAQGDSTTGGMWECPLLVRPPRSPAMAPLTPRYTNPDDWDEWILVSDLAPEFASLPGAARDPDTPSTPRPSLARKSSHANLLAAARDYEAPSTPRPTLARKSSHANLMAAAETAETAGLHMLAISPDSCKNPVLYYLGPLDPDGTFATATAAGPFRLDYGDSLYAPNLTRDPAGRVLLWGWLQEHRPEGTPTGSPAYAGCLTVPRVLTLQGNHLHQAPAGELASLRRPGAARVRDIPLTPGATVPLPGPSRPCGLDIEVMLEPRGASSAELRIMRWDEPGVVAASLVVDWEAGGRLEVHRAPGTVPADAPTMLGGPIQLGVNGRVQLRVLLDHSALEVFTLCGHALATRVYRGNLPAGGSAAGVRGPRLEAACTGGAAAVRWCVVHEMNSVWDTGRHVGVPAGAESVPLVATQCATM